MQLPLLEVTNLRIALATPYGMVDTVRGIDFSLTALLGTPLFLWLLTRTAQAR